MAADKNAQDLVKDLGTATQEEATAVLRAEQEKGDSARTTVVNAAEARLEVLAVPGEPVDKEPEGVWAQLLDADGEPVQVDGKPVQAELTPATRRG